MKVVIAIDDSPYSEAVVETLLERKWPPDTQFKVLTVLEPMCMPTDEGERIEVCQMLSKIHKRREHSLEHLASRVRSRIESTVPDAIVHFEVREGSAKKEILNAAIEWQADRILLGAHGRDVCPHNLLGSVSRAVANHSPCSVEIVRPKKHAKQAS